MMAQPRAQTAENLVALDDWVRRGGRLLLFADPMLEWPSDRALGDPTRPPAMFADTGLLAHWGLRLDAPDVRGPAKGRISGHDVLTVSPGALAGTCDDRTGRTRRAVHHRQGQGLGHRRCRPARCRGARRGCCPAMPGRCWPKSNRSSRNDSTSNHRLIHSVSHRNESRTSNFPLLRKPLKSASNPANPIISHENPLYPLRRWVTNMPL